MSKVTPAQVESSNLGGAIALALFSVVLGAFLGFWSLSSEKAKPVREPVPPEKQEARTLYFITGETRGAGDWQAKRDWLLNADSGSVKLSEADLNAWVASTFRLPGSGEDGANIIPRNPNFRIAGGEMQFAVRLDFRSFAGNIARMLIVHGDLGMRGGKPSFHAREASLGAGRIPTVFAQTAARFLANLFAVNENYQDAIASLSDIRIEGDHLILAK